MKPTKKQFRAWTLPSKSSFLGYKLSKKGYVLTIISLIIAIISIYPIIYSKIEKYQTDKVKNKLSELLSKKEWETIGNVLQDKNKKYYNKDWFNYYSGVYSTNMHSVVDFKTPEYYFLKIDSNSNFFESSILYLLDSYSKIENVLLFQEKILKLIKTLEEKGCNNSEYFLTRLMKNKFSMNNNDVLKSYYLIKHSYKDLFSKKAGSISFNIKKIGEPISMNLGKVAKVYGVAFIHAYQLYKNNILPNDIILDLQTMFPNQETFTFALMGMDALSIQMNNNIRSEYRGFIHSINKLN